MRYRVAIVLLLQCVAAVSFTLLDGPQPTLCTPIIEQASVSLPRLAREPDSFEEFGRLFLAPELVTALSPEELFAMLPDTSRSEAGQDCLYEDYASALIPETNNRFPLSVALRSNLVCAFRQIVTIARIGEGGGTGFGHEWMRLPGRIEHYLYSGFRSNFAADSSRDTSLEDVRLLLNRLVNSSHQLILNDGRELEFYVDELGEASDQCMTALVDWERELNDCERQYFRSKLRAYIIKWMWSDELTASLAMPTS
jgi:hypothetical protein